MKTVADFPRIYLFRPLVDMRKQIHGLSAIVQEEMEKNPFDESLYVFCNRRRDLMKCLYWDHTGFAMWVKKLDEERFSWPKNLPDEVIFLSQQQMEWLLSGVNIWKIKTHKNLHFDRVL